MAEATLERFTPTSRIGDITAKELRTVITEVARGKALDPVRVQVVKRAEALGKGGLLPDNWNRDGSLKRAAAVWETDDQRETWGDLRVGLQAALDDLYADADDYYYWIWVQDFTDTEVIFCKGETVYSAPYSVTEGGPITIGEAVKVRPVTQYVQTETQRAAGPLKEWRKAKVDNLKGLERRTFASHGMELRDKDADTWNLTGFACVYDMPYDMGFYVETVRAGAGRRTLGENPDVQLLINHTDLPLARSLPGTLRLDERAVPDMPGKTGLFVDADLDKQDPDAQRLQRKMERRDLDAMSFAFQVTDQEWSDDYSRRDIKSYSLHRGDVSVVNQGANPAAYATIRSQDALAALHRIGPEAFVAAMTEWRDYTLLPLEKRAGATLSAATMEVLSQVLNLVSSADDAVDEAQPLLAELMGVPNPDADTGDDGMVEDDQRSVLPDYTSQALRRFAALNAGDR